MCAQQNPPMGERGWRGHVAVVAMGLLLASGAGAEPDDGAEAATDARRPAALVDQKGFVLTFDAAGTPLGLWVSAQARARGEAVGPRDLEGGDPALFVDHRMRLRTAMAAGQHLLVRFDIQDVRRWGEEVPLPGKPGDPTLFGYAAGGMDFHQGYVDLSAGELRLRVGRQELSFDDQRLIGAVDWTMQGRSFDGASMTLGPAKRLLTTFAAVVRDADTGTDPDNPVPDQAIAGAHYVWSPGSFLRVAPIGVIDARSEPSLLRWTVGARVNGAAVGFGYDVAGYYQGAVVDPGVSVAALVAASVSYTVDTLLHPSFGAFADVVSGDTDPSSLSGLSPFDTLYGTNHKFYGFQDLFLNLPLHTRGRGLTDVGVRAKMSEGWFFTALDLHLFAAADLLEEPLFGVEPDLTVGLSPLPGVKVVGGASCFVPIGGGLGRGNQVAPWVYLMLVTEV